MNPTFRFVPVSDTHTRGQPMRLVIIVVLFLEW